MLVVASVIVVADVLGDEGNMAEQNEEAKSLLF